VQEDLFDGEVFYPEDSPTITCRHCNKEKPKTAFRLYRRATGDHRDCRSTSCKDCQKYNNKVANKIRETAPLKPQSCQCCGSTVNRLVLDHCYETETFRGWICHHCNLSIGHLGDTIEGLEMAIRYLRRKGKHDYLRH
jgi:hypothetical protein